MTVSIMFRAKTFVEKIFKTESAFYLVLFATVVV
jgi:hypothetical protein